MINKIITTILDILNIQKMTWKEYSLTSFGVRVCLPTKVSFIRIDIGKESECFYIISKLSWLVITKWENKEDEIINTTLLKKLNEQGFNSLSIKAIVEKDIQVKKYRAKDIIFSSSGNIDLDEFIFRTRVYYTNNGIYSLTLVAHGKFLTSTDVNIFLNSFKLIEENNF